MWSVRRPSLEQIRRHREQQRELAFSYEAVGATLHGAVPAGFDHDHNRQPLGAGAATFTAARDAIRAWAMFPAPLTQILPAGIPIVEGEVAAVVAHALGLWWLNAARIVYVIDEPRRFGFAYGTLPGHVERGEERFLVEWLDDDSVWYDLSAFSRPGYWMARLARPLTRRLQRRFARLSKTAMRNAVLAACSTR
jgi:uncharacterized protein (UPF0548 family)